MFQPFGCVTTGHYEAKEARKLTLGENKGHKEKTGPKKVNEIKNRLTKKKTSASSKKR